MKHLVINDSKFPFSEKQERHSKSGITGLNWAVYFKMKELPEEKDSLWTAKEYNRINGLARFRAEQSGEPLSKTLFTKTLWYVLFNQPKTLIIYTNKLDSFQMNVIKFCLTHNITVALEDMYSSTKQVFKPVCNLFSEPLFKKFKVEEVNTETLTDDLRSKVHHKLHMLQEARYDFMKNVNAQVNELLLDLDHFYKLDNIESLWERYVWADRYRAQEVLKNYGASITIYDLDKPEVMTAIKSELRIWAPVFGISVKLDSNESTCLDTLGTNPNKPTYAGNDGYFYAGEDLIYADPNATKVKSDRALEYSKTQSKAKFIYRLNKARRYDALADILSAYMQVKFYQEHLNEFFPTDTHYFCQCGLPVSRNADACDTCGKENSDKYPETISYEYLSYKLDRE